MLNFPYRKWDFLAIGGVGMSAIAKVMKHFGCQVTGTDLHESQELERLRKFGISIRLGHSGKIPDGTEAVVYSSAIPQNNPELWAARSKGLAIFHRAEMLAHMMNQSTSVGVTGTHGKSTTSALISFLLNALNKKPTCLVGGDIRNAGDNVILGSSDYIVAEIDESDQTQELARPDVAVITNIEADHLDQYGDLAAVEASFVRFVDGLDKRWVIGAKHDEVFKRVAQHVQPPHFYTFGFDSSADFYAENISISGLGSNFDVLFKGNRIRQTKLSIPGKHNVANALAGIAAMHALGMDMGEVLKALPLFKGVRRRLEVLIDEEDLLVVDDYAHHPTEVQASIQSLKMLGRPLTVIFQPHRFSRTVLMAETFGDCFRGADRVWITDIYAADEKPLASVSSQLILEAVRKGSHPDAEKLPRHEIINRIESSRIPQEIIAFFGAGDIGELAYAFGKRKTEMPV